MGSYTKSVLTNRKHLEIEAKFHLNIYLNMSSEETKHCKVPTVLCFNIKADVLNYSPCMMSEKEVVNWSILSGIYEGLYTQSRTM